MELVYFFIALGVCAIFAGIWGYYDHRKSIEKHTKQS